MLIPMMMNLGMFGAEISPDIARYGPALTEEERRRWFGSPVEQRRRRSEKEREERVAFGILPAPRLDDELDTVKPPPVVARKRITERLERIRNISPTLDNIARAAIKEIEDEEDDVIAIFLLH